MNQTITKVTEKQMWLLYILKNIKNCEWTTPTEVGKLYGELILLHVNGNSATVSEALKKLVRVGYIQRSEKGHYRFVKPPVSMTPRHIQADPSWKALNGVTSSDFGVTDAKIRAVSVDYMMKYGYIKDLYQHSKNFLVRLVR